MRRDLWGYERGCVFSQAYQRLSDFRDSIVATCEAGRCVDLAGASGEDALRQGAVSYEIHCVRADAATSARLALDLATLLTLPDAACKPHESRSSPCASDRYDRHSCPCASYGAPGH